jgi:hypothetical protein
VPVIDDLVRRRLGVRARRGKVGDDHPHEIKVGQPAVPCDRIARLDEPSPAGIGPRQQTCDDQTGECRCSLLYAELGSHWISHAPTLFIAGPAYRRVGDMESRFLRD